MGSKTIATKQAEGTMERLGFQLIPTKRAINLVRKVQRKHLFMRDAALAVRLWRVLYDVEVEGLKGE